MHKERKRGGGKGKEEKRKKKSKDKHILQPFVSTTSTDISPLACFFTAFRKSLKNVNGLVAKQPLGMKNEPAME